MLHLIFFVCTTGDLDETGNHLILLFSGMNKSQICVHFPSLCLHDEGKASAATALCMDHHCFTLHF